MGGGHGIGIKRNDYRRRNRKANISTHSHKHGHNKQSTKVRVIKYRETLLTPYVEAWNEKEEERWEQLLESFRLEEQEDEILWEPLTSLERECLIYQKPILSAKEIQRRRFENGIDNNDRWWEWEEELGLNSGTARKKK